MSLSKLSVCLLSIAATTALAQTTHPWTNTALTPQQRADLVLREMTLDEKIAMLHGTGQPGQGPKPAEQVLSNGGAGFVIGVPRLGIPGIQMADAAYGVTKSEETGRYSTALPSNLALAATWDLNLAADYGKLIGTELRAQGYSMTLGGGVDLARDPRNGRNFEYGGEDPLLAGIMVGSAMKGLQTQHVIGDVKHYALNDQEAGRTAVDPHMDERTMRETDLLAFQLAIKTGNPGGVMCAYNRVNGDYACENKFLLTDVLRNDWHFQGFVLSDWGGTHSTVKASHAGLDNEEPNQYFYGEPFKQAVLAGTISKAELDEHVRRILFAEFSSGLVDHPIVKSVVDPEAGLRVSQHIAERSIVLLKNDHNILPIDPAHVHTIAVIGLHADVGMISGGGSAQVDPPIGNAIMPPGMGHGSWMAHIWFPTSPLEALRTALPNATIKFADGTGPDAAKLAASSDLAIVLAYQWESEGMDIPSLSLPEDQDGIITRVAAAQPRTIVVLETGTAVTMPWLDKVAAVTEAWYGGNHAAQAVARVLTGKVNPGGKLPMTFPISIADLPNPTHIDPPPASTPDFYGKRGDEVERNGGLTAFTTRYNEGLNVGYKWYAAKNKPVLFPFGFGLSYTTFAYSNLKLSPDGLTAHVTVTNTGERSGTTTAQLYAALPATDEPQRLVAWSTTDLAPGEHRDLTLTVEPLTLQVYDLAAKSFTLTPGSYTFKLGSSSTDLPLTQTLTLNKN